MPGFRQRTEEVQIAQAPPQVLCGAGFCPISEKAQVIFCSCTLHAKSVKMHPMTPDMLYQIAIGAVVSALIASVNMLWKRSEECEKWRNKAAPVINQMQNLLGMATGTINLVDQCSQEKCPFAGKLSEMHNASLSLRKEHDKHLDPL